MAEESEMVGQLRSLIISMEGWRGQEEREEVQFLTSHFFCLVIFLLGNFLLVNFLLGSFFAW